MFQTLPGEFTKYIYYLFSESYSYNLNKFFTTSCGQKSVTGCMLSVFLTSHTSVTLLWPNFFVFCCLMTLLFSKEMNNDWLYSIFRKYMHVWQSFDFHDNDTSSSGMSWNIIFCYYILIYILLFLINKLNIVQNEA